MTGVLILTAVEFEARTLARDLELPRLSSLPFPAYGQGRVRLAPVGLRAGLLGARWRPLLDGASQPLIVSAGVCGALDPRLACGDLVIPESVLDPWGRRWNVTPSSHRQVAALAGAAAHTGSVVTAHEVAESASAKAALRHQSGAVAVDMESSVIVSAAAAAGCASLVIRGVSDDATQSLPRELTGLLTPEGRLLGARALLAAVRRPGVLAMALDLRRGTRRALRAVARLLAQVTATER